MKKVYYAHCMALYDTPQEARDVELLRGLGFEVLNPNSRPYAEGALNAKLAFPKDPSASMMIFKPLVESCNLLAFRALPDGFHIPAGVYLEIEWARAKKMPVIELPSSVLLRGLTREQTREYIREVGRW